MATMRHRCPVDPACPEQDGPGYCDRHPLISLEPVRETPTPTTQPGEPPTATAGGAPPQARSAVSVRFLGWVFAMPDDELVLGRIHGPLASVPGMAELTQVSRYHARLYWLGDVLYIQDGSPDGQPSTNHTYIDGVRVADRRRVAPGQRVRLGMDVDVELVAEDLDEFGMPR